MLLRHHASWLTTHGRGHWANCRPGRHMAGSSWRLLHAMMPGHWSHVRVIALVMAVDHPAHAGVALRIGSLTWVWVVRLLTHVSHHPRHVSVHGCPRHLVGVAGVHAWLRSWVALHGTWLWWSSCSHVWLPAVVPYGKHKVFVNACIKYTEITHGFQPDTNIIQWINQRLFKKIPRLNNCI